MIKIMVSESAFGLPIVCVFIKNHWMFDKVVARLVFTAVYSLGINYRRLIDKHSTVVEIDQW